MILQPFACIIDAMALVKTLKGDHKTFAKVADSLLSLVLHEESNSRRIDERELNLEMNLETFNLSTKCSSGENSFESKE